MFDRPGAISINGVYVVMFEQVKVRIRRRMRVSEVGNPGRDSNNRANERSGRTDDKVGSRRDNLINLFNNILRAFN